MILLFAFSFNPENKEAAFSGNLEPERALQLLQGIVISNAVGKAKEAEKAKESKPKVK